LKRGLMAMGITSLLLTAACGGSPSASTPGNNQGSGSSSEPESAAPVKITMMNQYLSAEPPNMNSEAIKLLQEYTNTELDITWVPGSSYNEKVTASIAAASD